jgi:lipopolysaccharide/colanic/teichoic acid biosynthesis glycosyltransferase
MSSERFQRAVKRAVDASVAGAVLLAFCPLLVVVWLSVRWKMGKPAIFRQQRPGLHERPFVLYKFRTMTDACGPDGAPKPDGERLTPLGRLLRRTSLDELPQFWNVLRGDMSLVGPRPLLTQYLERYTPEQARRHDVPPGITGWAQINGRNAVSWEEKFALDCWYVDHWSLRLDLRILLKTIGKVFCGEGINAASCVTMFEFRGSEPS